MLNISKRIGSIISYKTLPVLAITLLTPFTTYLLMQFILGTSLSSFSFLALLGNGLCIGIVYALLCAISGRPILSSILCHSMFGIWGAANYFVSVFRGTPVLPWDLTALGTAAAVAGSYDFTPTWQMTIALLLIVVGIVLAIKYKKPLFNKKQRLVFRCGSVITGLVLMALVAFTPLLANKQFKPDVWNQIASYKKGGAVAVFLRNLQFLEVEQPADFDPNELEEHFSSLPESPVATGQTPNIIAIMNESWADYEEFGNISLSKPVNEYMSSLPNSIWGHCFTSVTGAGTSLSEFEFLTGNSMAFLPSGSIPYQQYITAPTSSIVSSMKTNGYRTLAIHPGEHNSWQRNLAYPLLGFDQFKSEEDLNVPITKEHGYISDDTSFKQIIWEYENKAPNEKLFLFNVTIQSHGAYTVKDYPAEITVTGSEGLYPKAEQYLTLVSKTDEAFKQLVDYFSNQDEPTIILMFGDHQPAVETEFLDKAFGVTQDNMTMEQYMSKYRTPFLIWANYPLPETEIPDSSLNFLSQYLIQYTGLPQSDYDRYLWNLHQTLPAITFVGYTDSTGKAYSHLETNDFTPLIQRYQAIQYNNLFGKTNRHNDWFAPVASIK